MNRFYNVLSLGNLSAYTRASRDAPLRLRYLGKIRSSFGNFYGQAFSKSGSFYVPWPWSSCLSA